jgi:hypothetical protein
VLGNPINLTDSSGFWDDDSRAKVKALRQAFLDSAARHNRIWQMDNNAFAALIASTIEKERRMGDYPSWAEDPFRSKWGQMGENLAIHLGCVVSGHFFQACFEEQDWQQCLNYLLNEIPEGDPINTLASVGIGNIKLETAANLWRMRQDCVAHFDEQLCKELEKLSPLADIRDPFDPHMFCYGGRCVTYRPSETQSYSMIGLQLLDDRKNIEYAAANLEAGALRAKALGLDPPSAFSAVMWHQKGIQTLDEIIRSGLEAYTERPIRIMEDVVTPLSLWGLASSWDPSKEPAYESYGNQTEYEWWKKWLVGN